MLDYTKSFIEEQFPVAKLSKESYRERKAGRSQTLTGLGKWWGRKPLILVRAALFGILLPVSGDRKKDKEIFLKILTMDEEGFWRRHEKQVRKMMERDIFNRLDYDDLVDVSCRPEELDGPDEAAWQEINAHLEMKVNSLQELAQELGRRRFGHVPRVGDCFAGGGSNVFEPARMGCDVYGSDLNPLAGVLTWADLNLLGCTEKEQAELKDFQERVFDAVCAEIDALGVETNPEHKPDSFAKYYLYCNEVKCPECDYMVPALPSLIVSKKQNLVVQFEEEPKDKRLKMRLVTVKAKKGKKVADLIKEIEKGATIQNNSLVCPHCHRATSIAAIRGGDEGSCLRRWEKSDFTPRPDDIFRERLYAIKYVQVNKKGRTKEGLRKKPGPVTDYTFGTSYYTEPTEADLRREQKVQDYVAKHFAEWQKKGYIPDSKIIGGYNTDQLTREKGWTYWHQLFNPRQLLFIGLVIENVLALAKNTKELVVGLLCIHKVLDYNSKLCAWVVNREYTGNTFYNQALNTLYNYATRSTFALWSNYLVKFKATSITSHNQVLLCDAAEQNKENDIWLTDPPYADAVNYHELSEFFLAWDKPFIRRAFPDWYTDSKRALAIKGEGRNFNRLMVAAYKNLAKHMPDNGRQIVMFTHQDTRVWAELAMILWSAGLQVTAAWCIATETESGGLKQGNYVKGTVLMVLRKRVTDDTAFDDDLYEKIRDTVKEQIESMRELDDVEKPDFNDGDYLLAAYVAALKVLTSYAKIEGIEVEYELEKARESNTDSPVTEIINKARKEAYDYLVPEGIRPERWRRLVAEERFYLKGLAMELNGVHKNSAFQELARGFAVADYTDMMGTMTANKACLKTPQHYRRSQLEGRGFAGTLTRQVLAALYFSKEKDDVREGLSYLKSHYQEGNEYWRLRTDITEILEFLGKTEGNEHVEQWQDIAKYIGMLRAAISNDSV